MEQNLLIGTYSKNGIYKIQFNNGIITPLQSENSFENCSYLCQEKNTIYSIVEYSDHPLYQDGYLIARASNLSPMNTSPLSGKGPCFITIDKLRNMLYVANYGDGSMDVFSLNTDGSINQLIKHKTYTSHSRIHYIALSNDYRFLFVSDLGNDTLFAYKIISDEMHFELKELDTYHFPIASGPRHLVMKEENLYVITENSCELFHLSFSEKDGFHLIDYASILPSHIQKEKHYTGCAIKISNSSPFLYCSIRGHNSISVFEITPSLKLIQNISCFGDTPRDINFNATQDFLLCANQLSGDISIFHRNQKTGYLHLKHKYPIDSPACIIPL